MKQVKIPLGQLRAATDQLFQKLDELGVTHVDSDELYWKVSLNEWQDMSTSPVLSVGSISDDADEVQRIGSSEYEVSLTDLDRVASLLRAIQYQLVIKKP